MLGWLRDKLGQTFAGRSGKWPKVRAEWLAEHDWCIGCGTKDSLEVHHVSPVSIRPELELVQSNLETMCPRCHLLIGHLGSWHSYNVNVRTDAAVWLQKIRARP